MISFNRNSVLAMLLLAFCAGAYWKTFDIQTRNDGIMHATVWPRLILAFMFVFALVYLVRSLRQTRQVVQPAEKRGVMAWLHYYRNPIWCFALYFAFLASLPYLGMLIGGALLVFLMLSVLGGFERRKLLLHAVIAVIAVGGMWAIFTFALKVILPAGEILPLIYRT